MHKLRIFTTSIVGFFLVLISFSAASAPTAQFNGYSTGMSRAAAKAIGYESCMEMVDRSVYCDIPDAKRNLGAYKADRAKLVFESSNLNTVKYILLEFNGNFSSDNNFFGAIITTYGAPFGNKEYRNAWRFGSDFITLDRGSISTTKIKFERDAAMAKLYDKAEQKNNAMKNF